MKNISKHLAELLMIFIAVMAAFLVEEWRETQKRDRLEQKILLELYEVLQYDTADLTYNIQGGRKAQQAFQTLRQHREQGTIPDSLNSLIKIAFSSYSNVINTSAYENLSSLGFDIIQNDSLRRQIQFIYGSRLRYLKELDAGVQSFLIQAIFELEDQLTHFSFSEPMTPLDPDGILLNDSFYYYLASSQSILDFHIHAMQVHLDYTRQALVLVDQELKTRF